MHCTYLQIKENRHDNFSSVLRIYNCLFYVFPFLFISTKFDEYHCDVAMQIAVLHVKVCRQPRISSQFCIWVVTFAFYLDDIYGLKMIWTIFISEIDNSVLVLKTAIINIYYAIVFFFMENFEHDLILKSLERAGWTIVEILASW